MNADKLNTLIVGLGVNANKLARALDFDPSYISRIRTGERTPGDEAQFMDGVARYIAGHFTNYEQLELIAAITGSSVKDVAVPEKCEAAIKTYLGSSETTVQRPASLRPLTQFLRSLDEFDLNAFKEEINFNSLNVPSMPFSLPTTKTYTGIEEMKQAELDFLKAAVLGRSTEDVIMYSDMPLEEMAEDKEFARKIMMGIALLVRKGVRLKSIHDIHRPIQELYIGLEGWIPVYMTGLMESYYLPMPTNMAFLHFVRSAGGVACLGEAVVGDQGSGRYIVSKASADVKYARVRAQQLLNMAKPLLRVFHEEDQAKEEKVLEGLRRKFGTNTIVVGEGQFENLHIISLPGHYVLIRKTNPPAVSILIEYPALVDALERYEPTLF